MRPVVCKSCGSIIRRGTDWQPILSYCNGCKESIKEDHPIRDVVFTMIPERLRIRRSSYDLYYCPLHDDRENPSLAVFNHHCTCYAGCTFNGKEKADVLDFVRQMYSIEDFPALLDSLRGLHMDAPPVQNIRRKIDREIPAPTMEQVNIFHRNVQDALDWFATRHVLPFTAYEKRLGMAPAYRNGYTFISGPNAGETVYHTTRRYSVPNIAFGKVRSVKLRRDDQYSQDQLTLMDPLELSDIKRDLAERETRKQKRPVMAEEITDSMLVGWIFGDRYPQLPSSDGKAIFNVERFASLSGGDLQYIEWPYGLIHEGEFKAMAMEDCVDGIYGFPSVSNLANESVGKLLQNCKRKIYVQDNDEAGEKNAEKHRKWIPDLEVIKPPDGLKAADDVVNAGSVLEWMASIGIEPVKLNRAHT